MARRNILNTSAVNAAFLAAYKNIFARFRYHNLNMYFATEIASMI